MPSALILFRTRTEFRQAAEADQRPQDGGPLLSLWRTFKGPLSVWWRNRNRRVLLGQLDKVRLRRKTQTALVAQEVE